MKIARYITDHLKLKNAYPCIVNLWL